MLMMHVKNRAIQMITRLSDPVNGLEIWKRFLEVWEPVNRGRHRAMLMQLLQCPLTESRGQAIEEWKRLARQYEAQKLTGHAPVHNLSNNIGTQPTGFSVVQKRQTKRDEIAFKNVGVLDRVSLFV